MMMILAIIVLTLIQTTLNQQDQKVNRLPDWPSTQFNIYSGLMNISNSHKLHYVFMESQNEPSTDPLILWLNGEPGCSSIMQLFDEIGPYIMTSSDKQFQQNVNSIQLKNNMIFLDSPVGVGYSQNHDKNPKWNDDSTVHDIYTFLKLFLELYSQYQQNDLYIASRGYGTVYVGKLVQKIIIDNSKQSDNNNRINLQGLLIGNGLFSGDQQYLLNQIVQFMGRKQLLSNEMVQKYLEQCQQYEYDNQCDQLINQISRIVSNINLYNIYQKCEHDNLNSTDLYDQYYRFLLANNHPLHLLFDKQNDSVIYVGQNPCQQNRNMNEYMNRTDVKKALNVNSSIEWQQCNPQISRKYIRNYNVVDIYNMVIKYGLRVLVYSGDTDMTVPTMAVLNSLKQLDLDIVERWRPWINANTQQTAGFVAKYKGILFTSVRGSGHMIGIDKAEEFYMVIDSYLQRLDLPRQSNEQYSFVKYGIDQQ